MEKTTKSHGAAKMFLLGVKEDERVYLCRPSFDCEWYWGMGYLRYYNGRSRDYGFSHFDYRMKTAPYPGYEYFITGDFLTDRTFTEKEGWKLYELIMSAYKAREYSDMLHIGGAHYTENPCKGTICNHQEYYRINTEVLPALFEQIEILLSPEKERPVIEAFWATEKENVKKILSKKENE